MAGLTLGVFAFSIYYAVRFTILSYRSHLLISLFFPSLFNQQGYPVSHNPSEPGPARGIAFVTLAMIQLLHAFPARSIEHTMFSRDIFNNR